MPRGEARLSAGGELHAYAVQDVHSVMDRKKVTRSSLGANLFAPGFMFPSGSTKTETRDSRTREAQVTQLQSAGELTTQSGGDTLLQGTRIAAAQTTLEVGVGDKAQADATLILEGAKSRLDTSHTVNKKSLVWQSQSGQGESTETLTLVNIQGPVTLQAQKIVAQLPEGNFKTQLEKQAAQPGQAWMLQLADRPGWTGSHRPGPRQVGLQAGGADGGSGADHRDCGEHRHCRGGLWRRRYLGRLGQYCRGLGCGGAAASAAASAALTALATQATLSLINNKGNLGKTLSDLGSSDTVKGCLQACLPPG
jgi:large exoprotein involved in heme utilization and adhesion